MRSSTWFLLTVILFLSFGLRLYKVGEMSLRADEATNLFLAAQNPADIIRPFITEDPHLPLYHLVLHFWMLATGQSELAVRFVTIFAGVLTVALTFLLSRTIFPAQPELALAGAFLAGINPYLVWDAQDAYMYSLLTAITVCSLILFMRVMQAKAGYWSWVGYIAANLAGLFLHYLAGLVLLAQGAIWLLWTTMGTIPRRKSIAWLASQLAVALLFLPWLVFALPLLSNFKSGFWVAIGPLEMLQRSLVAFSVGRMESRLMPPMIDPVTGNLFGTIFLVLLLIGLLARNDRDRRGRMTLVLYLGTPLAALYLFSMLRFPIYDERYVLFLIPAFVVIVARGITMFKSQRYGWMPAGALMVVIVASGYSLYNYFKVPAFSKSPDWHSFMGSLMAQARPGDVLIQNYPDPALTYYLQNRMPRVLLPRTGNTTLADVDADLTRLTAKYERIWLQPVPFGQWDYDGLVETWLNRHARFMTASEFRGLHLSLYLPVAVALRQAVPINGTFEESVRLRAFDLGPNTVQPGAMVHLTLYWELLKALDRSVTVFVHFYDDKGRLLAQEDNVPVAGTFPIGEWQPLQITVDPYDVQVPPDAPAGSYSLMVGLYDSQTLQRLVATNPSNQGLSENRLLLGTIRVASPDGPR